MQQIVDEARVPLSPWLYYHFQDQAGLFWARAEKAQDKRHRLMQAAAASAADFKSQLARNSGGALRLPAKKPRLDAHRLCHRVCALPGEVPRGVALFTRSAQRNFEFIHAPMKKAVAVRVLDRQFDSRELALGFYGQLNCYLVMQWLMPDCRLNRQKAVRIVNLFPAGAAGKPRAA